MQKKVLFSLAILVFGSQLKAQSIEHLQQINNEVYSKFYMAFDSLDYQLMAEIHAKDLIRIPANQKMILDYETYIDGYKKSFQEAKEKKETRSISLRFFERIVNDSVATDRGVYKFSLNKNTPEERNYYGQFHVLLVKREGSWKILMDYDSNEESTIDKDDFLAAFSIDDLEKFIK